MNNHQKLKSAFSEALNIRIDLVTDNLAYQSIPEWDSGGHRVLITYLELYFGISMNTQDITGIDSAAKAKEILVKYNISF